MDIDEFLLAQKNKLQVDKDRLELKTTNNSRQQENLNSIGKIKRPVKNCNETLDQHKQCNKNSFMDFQPQVIDPPTDTTTGVRQLISATSCTESSIATSSPMDRQLNEKDADNENNVFLIYDNISRKYCEFSNGRSATKTAKDLANLTERQFQGVGDGDGKNLKLHKSKDDMEQWVTDTFYSYFPGFNNENKKRQDILHDRQLEYEQNFIKHQMIEAAANSGKKKHQHSPSDGKDENTQDPNLTPLTSRSDKTDLEIIVNNPDYEAKSPRPGSARHKLLQDLKHTEISNILNSDGVTERNRRIAEAEMAKKKDYQKDLMAQIEEKRRSIEMLKEKERRQEEALTRKLQEQLKTMRLQEELEKEKMRADKIRFDSEQNRLMREHLLTKLENDSKFLCSSRKPRSENDKVTPPENKVYKYFSNSARHEYRGLHTEPPPFHLELPQPSIHGKECFHNDDNTCPFCNSALKSYESWCLKCEKRIFKNVDCDLQHLVCDNCKNQYSVCAKCDKTADQRKCTHCQRKCSICASCRRTMCSDCINANTSEKDQLKTNLEKSFEILEVNYHEESEYDSSPNNINDSCESSRPPFSMNIDRNSIFHHSFNRSKLLDDENNIETIRYETDKRLSQYFKNYGDLASKALRDRSTQTTPDSASRRDIVMVEENNLSMPLLREMPRMTRKESNMQQQERKTKGTRIENLARRWEVPAVQKHTITTNSPKVLTQLGAIRKQLQSEQFHLDD